jgi:hypothetical protein
MVLLREFLSLKLDLANGSGPRPSAKNRQTAPLVALITTLPRSRVRSMRLPDDRSNPPE